MKKKENNNILVWLTGIQTILLVILVFQVGSLDVTAPSAAPAGPAAAPTARPSVPTPNPTIDMKTVVDDGVYKGDKDAPVTIVEFSDFECPFCGRFYRDTLPQITEKYINTGKVRFVYRNFPLSFHPNAQKAAEAAECAEDQDKFWEMHDLLFGKGVSGGVDTFKQFAVSLGLDTSEFNNCLDSGKHASEVQKDFRDGQAAGISGTPGFVINGKLLSGAQPFAVFQQAIEDALGGK
ncbi:MAG: DsbA family protein [Candidatus Nanoarchaeia archaeon]